MAKGVQANLQDAVLRRINQLCKQKGWSHYRLAIEAGVSTRTVNYIVDGKNKSINLNTIKKFADAFDMDIVEFFDTAYFRNLPRE